MTAPFPTEFRCPFLRNVAEAFLKRRKAIAHGRDFEWEAGDGDDGEWLSLWLMGHRGHAEWPTLALHLWEGNRGKVFLRSPRSAERGKVLLRIDDMWFVNDGPGIVEAFEDTGGLRHRFHHEEGTADEIRELWRGLTLTVDS